MRKPTHRRDNRQLGLQNLEVRQVMANMAFFNDFASFGTVGDFATEAEQFPSQGSITFHPTTRNVSVEGSETRDAVTIQLNTRGTAATDDDMIQVSLANTGKSLSAQYRLVDVAKVVVNSYGGDDLIDNRSAVEMNAYAGAGRDVIFGGQGIDALLGGDDSDYIDGRAGSDSIWGQRGVDALFGDDGDDLLFGGDDIDYLFGGNGNDLLYGELGADRLYGGAGTDKLTDSGSNTLYPDYGPDGNVFASGFQAFDWFDRNLQDPALRSLARSQYRDGMLKRPEILQTYRAVADDGTVSSAELADLKDMVSSKINLPDDSRFLASKVVNGDRANATYQGSALGNLKAGTADRLHKLVNKWFMGGDLPMVGTEVSSYARVNGNLFVNGISYDDVRQGAVADCYLLAALGEVAQHSPSTIANMFIDNGDGTFTVRFFRDGQSQYVTVNRDLPVNKAGFAIYAGWGGAHSNMATNEIWVALVEKAYAQLNESGWIAQSGYNSYRGLDYGQSSNAFKHLTNKSASVVTSLSNAALITAIGSGKAITLASKNSGTAGNILSNHEYMVIGYNSVTKKFDLYQPAGSAFKPAAISLSWNEITANFEAWTSVVL